MKMKTNDPKTVTAYDCEWQVAASVASLADLGPEMRRLAASGLEQGSDFIPFKRGPRHWWLLRKLVP